MDEVLRLLLMLVLAGAALTAAGAVVIRLGGPEQRIRAALRRVLEVKPHAMVTTPARGRGAGFNFTSNMVAVAWDAGAWCLVYKLEELVGAELIVDGQVIARAYRAEARRALDAMTGAEKQVRLRLVFDDPRHPDFDLDLWLPEDDGRKGAMSAQEAVQEANRWITRTEALLRRNLPRRPAAPATPQVDTDPAFDDAIVDSVNS